MSKRFKYVLTVAYILIQLILYISVFAVKNIGNYFLFVSIALNLVLILLFFKKQKQYFALATALFFTLVADVFLVLYDGYYEIAVCFFSVAQLAYAARLFFLNQNKKLRVANIAARLILIIAAEIIIACILKADFDFLCLAAIFYFANLIVNVSIAIFMVKAAPLYAAGLFLFLLCDICVGLFNISDYIEITNAFLLKIIYSPVNWSWVFYLPSQVLIVLDYILNLSFFKLFSVDDKVNRNIKI